MEDEAVWRRGMYTCQFVRARRVCSGQWLEWMEGVVMFKEWWKTNREGLKIWGIVKEDDVMYGNLERESLWDYTASHVGISEDVLVYAYFSLCASRDEGFAAFVTPDRAPVDESIGVGVSIVEGFGCFQIQDLQRYT